MESVINVLHPLTVALLMLVAFGYGYFRGYKRMLTKEMRAMMDNLAKDMTAKHAENIRKNVGIMMARLTKGDDKDEDD